MLSEYENGGNQQNHKKMQNYFNIFHQCGGEKRGEKKKKENFKFFPRDENSWKKIGTFQENINQQ